MAYYGNKVIKRNAITGEIVAIYPTMMRAAHEEGVSKETIRAWCNGKPQRYESRYTFECAKTERQKKAAETKKEKKNFRTKCEICDNACGGCSWSRELKPVDGWTATRRDLLIRRQSHGHNHDEKEESYIVHDCPEYVQDPPLEERIRRLRESERN